MSFFNRLTSYIFGVFIGSALVFVFFGDRISCSYLPNERVLKDMRDKKLNLNISIKDTSFIYDALDKGKIIFKNSNKIINDSCKKYELEHKNRTIIIESCKENIYIKQFL